MSAEQTFLVATSLLRLTDICRLSCSQVEARILFLVTSPRTMKYKYGIEGSISVTTGSCPSLPRLSQMAQRFVINEVLIQKTSNLLFPSLSASSVDEPLSFVVDSFSLLGVEDFIPKLERTVLNTNSRGENKTF